MAEKQKTIIITAIIAVLFIGVIFGAYFGYKKLSEKYDPSVPFLRTGKRNIKIFP